MNDKIEKCACGKVTALGGGPTMGWQRQCGSGVCWMGPICPTPEEAISAWNSVMRAVRIYREMKEKVESRAEAELDLTHLPKGKPTAYSEGGPAR